LDNYGYTKWSRFSRRRSMGDSGKRDHTTSSLGGGRQGPAFTLRPERHIGGHKGGKGTGNSKGFSVSQAQGKRMRGAALVEFSRQPGKLMALRIQVCRASGRNSKVSPSETGTLKRGRTMKHVARQHKRQSSGAMGKRGAHKKYDVPER